MALLPTLIIGAMVRPAHGAEYLAALGPVSPSAVTFDDGFLSSGDTKVDLTRFDKPNSVLPGTYRADIKVNKEWRARADISMVDVPGSEIAKPCFDATSLDSYGIDLAKVVDAASKDGRSVKSIPSAERFCGALGDYIPGALADFDAATQSLDITVAQIYTKGDAKGYVDPKYWDEGTNAGAINYNANLYRSTGARGSGKVSGYVGIDASANFGSWHLVHRSSFSWREHQGRDYNTAANFLQHDIPELKSQFYAGDLFTSGRLFDSSNLRGFKLESDDRMLPQSLRGYAPIVRGVAETNARVVIRQRGVLLRELTVAPGPFEITDLFPNGYGSDLEVEIIEADGRSKRFNVPFAATPQSLRAGQSRWEVAAGKVRQHGKKNTPLVAQATYQRGLNNTVTAYGGVTLASGYQAALVGGALNTQVGAFSVDVTGAKTSLMGAPNRVGTSVRLAYSKSLENLGTNFTLAAYRYSTSGYVGLNDLTYLRDTVAEGEPQPFGYGRTRSEFTATVNQRLGEKRGQVFLSGAHRSYWGDQRKQVDFNLGYSNSWKTLSYSLSAQRTLETTSDAASSGSNISPGRPIIPEFSRRETRFMLSASLPLGSENRAPNLDAWLEKSTLAPPNARVGVSGALLDDRQLTYNVSLARGESQTSYSASTQYNGAHGTVFAGYSQGSGYKQVNAGVSGGLVLHGGGHTWAPTLGETPALIHAPGAKGAKVGWGRQSRVDSNGYAVVTNLVPYQLNLVTLDPKGSSLNVELKETSRNIAPRARTVAKIEFQTESGKAILIEGTKSNGEPIPFGAEIYDDQGTNIGVAGQGGQAIIRSADKPSRLTVRWGEQSGDQCHIDLNAAQVSSVIGVDRYQAACM